MGCTLGDADDWLVGCEGALACKSNVICGYKNDNPLYIHYVHIALWTGQKITYLLAGIKGVYFLDKGVNFLDKGGNLLDNGVNF